MKTRVIEVGPRYAEEALILRASFNGRLSPYDIPERTWSEYDEKKKRFRVVFEYLTPEEPQRAVRFDASIGGGIILGLGKRSSKLYSVEIHDIEREEIPLIRVEIVEAIENYAKQLPYDEPASFVPMANLKLTKAVLERESTLFATASG